MGKEQKGSYTFYKKLLGKMSNITKILGELNTIGARFAVPVIRSSCLPEKIAIASLGYSLEDGSIPGVVLAILNHHKDIFRLKFIKQAIRELTKKEDHRAMLIALIGYGVLSKTSFWDAELSDNLKDYTKNITKHVKAVFDGQYELLKEYAQSKSIDPNLSELGLTLPLITKEPQKKIEIDKLQFRLLNLHWAGRVCKCGGVYQPYSMRRSTIKYQQKSFVVKAGLVLERCEACESLSVDSEKKRSDYLKQLMSASLKNSYKELRNHYPRLQNKQFAQLLGISQEHFSQLLSGRYVPSLTLVNFMEMMSKNPNLIPVSN